MESEKESDYPDREIKYRGTGSLFEIKNECEKRGLPFHFNIITHADYEVSPRNLGGLLKLFYYKGFSNGDFIPYFLNDNFCRLDI